MMRRYLLSLASVALVFVVSCAYYNIFWMAESDYEKAVELGGYDFLDPFDQPQLQSDSERLITSTIERCGKLLLLHPNSGWVDDALFIMGNCFVIKGQHQNALRKYDEILQLYSDSEFVPMARYMKAYTLLRDGSIQQGITILEGLRSESKSKEVRERSVFLLGRTAVEQNNCSRAISFFETYMAEYPDGENVNRVRLNLAACLLREGKADRVVGVLEPLARKQGAVGLEASLRMGEAYREMGENDRAIEIFTWLTERAVEDTVRARAMMETARTMVARREAEEAVAILDEAAEIATMSNKALQDEIVFTKARVQEQHLQDFGAAIGAYDQIGKSQTEYGKMAGERSAALKDVQKFTGALQDTLPDSPEEEAEYRFMLGETYLDDLGLREEAFEQFKTVADSLPESGFGPQAILRTASMLEAKEDTLADVYYRKVIEMSPGSVYANFARSRLDLPLVNVEIKKPVVWEEGHVVGPALPGAPADSIQFVGPQLPSPPEPGRVPPDTTMRERRSPPDSLGRRRTVPGPPGLRFPEARPESAGAADSATGSGPASDSDTTMYNAPADSAGQGGRWTP